MNCNHLDCRRDTRGLFFTHPAGSLVSQQGKHSNCLAQNGSFSYLHFFVCIAAVLIEETPNLFVSASDESLGLPFTSYIALDVEEASQDLCVVTCNISRFYSLQHLPLKYLDFTLGFAPCQPARLHLAMLSELGPEVVGSQTWYTV